MTVLKVMCGIPAAGKTHYIKTHAKPEDLVVSRDKIRQSFLTSGLAYFSKEPEVFAEFCNQINSGIHKYSTIWVDATHLNNKSRWKLLFNIDRFAFEKIVFICVETPIEECFKRNAARPDISRVPESAMKSMADSYVRPSLNDFLSLNVEIEVIK